MRQNILYILSTIIFICNVEVAFAQNGETSLGKIPVYLFKIEKLEYTNYEGNKEESLTAVGYQHEAELFVLNVGQQLFYKIVIDGNTYAVSKKSFSGVSPQTYYHKYLHPGAPNKKYLPVPELTHEAGPYLLNLPFSNSSSASTTSKNQNTQPANNNQNQQVVLSWQLIGKVNAYNGNYRKTRDHGEDDVDFESEIGFLYSAFDGKKMKYKLVIPKDGSEYEVYENSSYDGSRVKWDRHGKHVIEIPPVSYMYTHEAGGYYFNAGDAR